jgi:UDP-N-acetylmuramate dehydrogenase
MDESLHKRARMPNSHCAGSVFKNPEGDSAGRLLEQAGMKGVRIGGAEVSAAHANILVTGKGARASDVEALIQKMQASVAFRFGVELELEVKILS